jgi:hypothetical protein
MGALLVIGLDHGLTRSDILLLLIDTPNPVCIFVRVISFTSTK